MKKINGIEFEDFRVELSNIIKDEKTTEQELICMFEFFREHMYVVDNEIKKRTWNDYQNRISSGKKQKGQVNNYEKRPIRN